MPPPIHLDTHAQFEDLWFVRKPDTPQLFLIWFVSGSSIPPTRIDKYSIEAAAQIAGVPLYVCDIDLNLETSRFCKVWAASTFVLCAHQKQLAQITSSDTHRVGMWISAEVAGAKSRLHLTPVPIIRSTVGAKPTVVVAKTI